MQGGKNRFLPKEMTANLFIWDTQWLKIWSKHLCPSMGPNGGSVAIDSGSYTTTLCEMVDLLKGSRCASPTLTSLGYFFHHDGMYARKWPLPLSGRNHGVHRLVYKHGSCKQIFLKSWEMKLQKSSAVQKISENHKLGLSCHKNHQAHNVWFCQSWKFFLAVKVTI